MKHTLSVILPAAALLAVGTVASAQTQVQRFERQLEQIQREQRVLANPEVPPEQRALFDYGGYFSFNFFAIDDTQQHTHILRQYDLVAYGRLNIDNAHELFLRARTGYRDWNSGDDFDGDGDESIVPTIEQGYYRFDLARYLGAYKGKDIGRNNLIFQGGRQFIYWGNGLVFADRLDGGVVDFTFGDATLEIIGGATPNDNVDIDSSRPDFDQDTQRNFYGGMLSYQVRKHRPFVYFLAQEDKNEDEWLRTPGDIVTRFRYDSQYFGAGSAGSIGDRLLYGVEFAYETGEGLSNSFTRVDPDDPTTTVPTPQTEEDIQAWAFDVRLDYLFADPRRTRLSTELIIASGDDDRFHSTSTFGGNRSGTDDEGFNAFGLLNTGLAFSPSVSNLITYRIGASTFPFPDSSRFRRFQVGVDLLAFAKFDKDAPIDEPTDPDERYLGFEPDLYLNWQITSDITIALRYGVFFPGSAIDDSATGGDSDNHPRHFFFTGVTFAF